MTTNSGADPTTAGTRGPGRATRPTVADLVALRAPLTRHCYRMLGSAADTDDAVQETLVRAERHLASYDPARASLSTWAHTIATRICLDMLRAARRRALVIDPQAPGDALGDPLPADRWVEPMPGALLFATTPAADPADVAVERESVRLAFVALLQRLPPRQRAVLLLCDVTGLSAREAADTLDTTVPGVTSALQRARARLADLRAGEPEIGSSAVDSDLLGRYVTAFEAHDAAALTAVLRDDVLGSMPPFAWSVRGGTTMAEMIATSDACRGDRMVVTDLNGEPGVAQYRRDADGRLRPFALVALAATEGRISHVHTFLGAGERFAAFGLPEIL